MTQREDVLHSLSPEVLYDSAIGFARTALDAYHSDDPRRLAIDAGTALEHLAKASLASRSPALLVELRSEGNWHSLLQLLGFPQGSSKPLRTVGLREVLKRVKTFVPFKVSADVLDTLIDLRDGAVHIAANTAIEESLLVAFVQFTQSLLEDLNRDRSSFWGDKLAVVDAILAEISDKVAHRVSVKIEAAKERFEREYGKLPDQLKADIIFAREAHFAQHDEEAMRCPACSATGLASGEHTVEWKDKEDIIPYRRSNYDGIVWFTAYRYACPVCGLRLTSIDEIDKVQDPVWELEAEETDPYMYDQPHLEREAE
jgi:hypothetical protein